MNGDVRVVVIGVLLVLWLPVIATGTIGGPSTPETSSVAAQESTPGDNETVYHRNPTAYDGDPEAAEIDRWLAEEMASGLEVSAGELSERDYDHAREVMGGEFDERLSQYVEITDADDLEAADVFEAVGDDQQALIATLESYDETATEYMEARDDGDDERARELARELEDLAETVDEFEDELQENYEAIDDMTEEDLSESREDLSEIDELVQDGQAEVREEEFVETALEVDLDSENVSALDPLTGSGELRTEDDSTVDDESIQLLVESDVEDDDGADVDPENRTVDAEIDEDGTVEFAYRPTDLPLGTEVLTLEYVPDDESVYLGSETTANVSVEQVESTVSDLEATDEVSYGDNISVEGTVAAGDEPVSDVPLSVTLEGESLGTVTATNGSFEGEFPVPRTITDGEGTMTAAVPFENRTLAGSSTTTEVTVRETDTALSVAADFHENDTVSVDGTFETGDGGPVGNESVLLQIGETPLGSATTDVDGEFDRTMLVPPEAEDGAPLIAAYDGSGSNLADARGEATGDLEGTSAWENVRSSPWTWLVAVAAVGLLLAAGWWYRQPPSAPAAPGSQLRTTSRDRSSSSLPTESFLSHAERLLSEGHPEEAVQASYAAVRRTLDTDEGSGRTHWEFYRQYRRDGRLEGDQRRLLRDVVEGYERTTFATTDVYRPEAEWILACARQLCDLEESATDTVTRLGNDE